MANINHMNPGGESVSETPSDEFLDQILHFQAGYGYTPADASFHLGNGNMAHLGAGNGGHGATASGGGGGGGFSLGLSSSLEQGRVNINGGGTFVASGSGDNHRSNNHLILHSSSLNPGFHGHGQPMTNTTPHPPAIRPRVRARRGQATDPHSIAERLRREKIAERIRALQELIPNVNKTDRAAMLDEVVDYVKFLRLQVKVLSMSRLGGAAAVAPLVTEIPVSSVEDDDSNGGGAQPAWEKWSNDGTERQVAKLMEENIGAALQLLQSKALCIMPLSLASAIYLAPPPDSSIIMEPESDPTPQSSNVQP